MVHFKTEKELSKLKQNLTRASKQLGDESLSEEIRNTLTKFEKTLAKIEKQVKKIEGRNDRMWKRFVESGYLDKS